MTKSDTRRLHEEDGKYISRKLKTYDDDSQVGSDEEADIQTTLSYLNTNGVEVLQKPNVRFKNYASMFNELIHTYKVTTLYPIVSTIIANDSSRVITVTKCNEREYYVKMYDLTTRELSFEEKVGGGPDQYIKLKEVEQNEKAT